MGLGFRWLKYVNRGGLTERAISDVAHDTRADVLDSSARVLSENGHSCPSLVRHECPNSRDRGGVSYIDCNARDADDLS